MNNFTNRFLTTDVDVLFEPASWLIKIDFITQFIMSNNVLISVLGDAGCGKTSFAQLLQEKLDVHVRSAILPATEFFEPAAFLEQMCSLLNIEVKHSVADIISELVEQNIRSLVIIDNAELLPEAFVKELLQGLQQQAGNEYFHVCLLSGFSLVKMTSRLARETYKEMIHSIELQPLSESESNMYVKACMVTYDLPKNALNEARLHQFYLLTEGNIASMNEQMVDFFTSKPRIMPHLIKTVMSFGYIPIVILFVVGGGYALYSKLSSDSMSYDTLANENINSIAIELPLSSEIPNYQLAATYQAMQVVSLQKPELWEKNEANEEVYEPAPVVMDKVIPIPKVAKFPNIKIKKIEKKVNKIVVIQKPKLSPAKLPGRFTLQLMASRDKNTLLRLAKQYPSSVGIKVRHFNQDGLEWYVLTQGEYAVQPQAHQALATLPKSLAQFKPWVRSTSNLKNIG